jgi:hypothetical protein
MIGTILLTASITILVCAVGFLILWGLIMKYGHDLHTLITQKGDDDGYDHGEPPSHVRH